MVSGSSRRILTRERWYGSLNLREMWKLLGKSKKKEKVHLGVSIPDMNTWLSGLGVVGVAVISGIKRERRSIKKK